VIGQVLEIRTVCGRWDKLPEARAANQKGRPDHPPPGSRLRAGAAAPGLEIRTDRSCGPRLDLGRRKGGLRGACGSLARLPWLPALAAVMLPAGLPAGPGDPTGQGGRVTDGFCRVPPPPFLFFVPAWCVLDCLPAVLGSCRQNCGRFAPGPPLFAFSPDFAFRLLLSTTTYSLYGRLKVYLFTIESLPFHHGKVYLFTIGKY
jgi:hypothetical protein